MNYDLIITNLENAVKEIENQGISIMPLNQAIKDLKSHSQNIKAVEENIKAIREEVIVPIKSELKENERAGKFSIWGFYVGAFALAVTAISLIYTTFFSRPNLELGKSTLTGIDSDKLNLRLDNIENSLSEMIYFVYGLNSNYKPTNDELKLDQFQSGNILKAGDNIFSVKAYIQGEEVKNGKWFPIVSLTFFINNQQLGINGVKEKIRIINNSGISYYYDNFNSIMLTENDGFIIDGKFKYEIKRIFRTRSQILSICDDTDGVLIKKIE